MRFIGMPLRFACALWLLAFLFLRIAYYVLFEPQWWVFNKKGCVKRFGEIKRFVRGAER